MIRVLALLAAILAAAFAVQGSQATFTATKSNPGSSFATTAWPSSSRSENTAGADAAHRV